MSARSAFSRPARVGLPLLAGVMVFVAHVRSPVITSFDSRWSIHTAMSLVREGNTDLDEYEAIVRREYYLTTERSGGHLYTLVPLGASLLAVPFVFVMDQVWTRVLGEDLDRALRLDPAVHERTERLVASVIVAVAAVFVHLLGRLAVGRDLPALLLAGIFAFATSAWSTASRALWQHGPSMLALTLTLYLILLARRRPAAIQYAALPLAFAYVARPTNGISVLLLTLYVLRRHRAYALAYLGWAGVVAVPFVAFNLAAYGALLPPYYRLAGTWFTGRTLEALAGHLVSPSRGLLVFSPVFLFAAAAAVQRLRKPAERELDAWLAGIVVLHWLAISAWPAWWGGHSYGPRLFSDVVPYLVYFLGPVVASLPRPDGLRTTALLGAFLLSVSAGVLIHHRGATSRHADLWNGHPVDVDLAPSRVWDWRDPQFLRGVGLPGAPRPPASSLRPPDGLRPVGGARPSPTAQVRQVRAEFAPTRRPARASNASALPSR